MKRMEFPKDTAKLWRTYSNKYLREKNWLWTGAWAGISIYRNKWSSRVVIEAVIMLLIAAKSYVWLILNIGIVVVLVKNTADSFGGDNKLQAQLIFFARMWIVPIDTINGAGSYAVTSKRERGKVYAGYDAAVEKKEYWNLHRGNNNCICRRYTCQQ